MKKVMFALVALFVVVSGLNAQSHLIAHYPFDGDAKNVLGDTLHGRVLNCSFSQDRFGNEFSSLQFMDFISCVEIENLKPMISFSCWVRVINSIDPQTLMWQGYIGGIHTFETVIDKNNSPDIWSIGLSAGFQPNLIQSEVWTHLTITPEYIFINGKPYLPIRGGDRRSYVGDIQSFVTVLGCGRDNGNKYPVRFFKGSIDDLFIYDKTIDLYEAQEIYQSALLTHVKNLPTATDMSVYPNPFSSVVSINSDVRQTVRISNLLGQTVYSADIEAGGTASWNGSSVPDGIYLLQTNKGIQKIMKTK